MQSKPQKRTAERLTCRKSWKSCLPAKTKARARMPPPFLQPSCALRVRFEAVLKGPEKVKLHARNQRQGCRHHRGELRKHSRAGSGIGEAAAEMLAEHGAKVVLGARGLDRLEALARRIAGAGAEVAHARETAHRSSRERHSGGRIRALRENQKFPLATRAYFPALFVNRLVRQSHSALRSEYCFNKRNIFAIRRDKRR